LIHSGICDVIYTHGTSSKTKKKSVSVEANKQPYEGNHPFKIKELTSGDFMGIKKFKQASIGKDGAMTGLIDCKNLVSCIVKTSKVVIFTMDAKDVDKLPIGVKVILFFYFINFLLIS
jgi:hypothetical protein